MYRVVYTILMAALAITVAVIAYLVLTGQRELQPNFLLMLAIFMLIVHGLLPLLRVRRRRGPPQK